MKSQSNSNNAFSQSKPPNNIEITRKTKQKEFSNKKNGDLKSTEDINKKEILVGGAVFKNAGLDRLSQSPTDRSMNKSVSKSKKNLHAHSIGDSQGDSILAMSREDSSEKENRTKKIYKESTKVIDKLLDSFMKQPTKFQKP